MGTWNETMTNLTRVKAAKKKLAAQLKGTTGLLATGIAESPAGLYVVMVLWRENVPMPGMPAEVDGFGIVVRFSGPIVAQ